MACAMIRCGGGRGESISIRRGGSDLQSTRPPTVVSVSDRRDRRFRSRISMSLAEMAPPPEPKLERKRTIDGRKGGKEEAVVSREKVDGWMRDSVAEIVKNLREAPLLVHVYAGSNGEVVTAKAEKAEDWPVVRGRWEKGEAEMPEGVILVEELEDDDEIDQDSTDGHDRGRGGGGGGGTRAWGIVAQGRGVDCGPVCYLLKTSRVGSGVGSGMWCTHFCLVKVKSFRETTKSQLQNCWLLQGGQ